MFGGNADERASFEVLDTYLELGGNFIDSADVYSKWIPGHRGGIHFPGSPLTVPWQPDA